MLTHSKQETKNYPRATQIYHQIWPRPQDDLTRGHLPYSPLALFWGSSEAGSRPSPDFLLWKETLGLVYIIYELWLKLRSRPHILFNICSKSTNFRLFCLIREANFRTILSLWEAVTSILTKVRSNIIIGLRFLIIERNPASASKQPQQTLKRKFTVAVEAGLLWGHLEAEAESDGTFR